MKRGYLWSGSLIVACAVLSCGDDSATPADASIDDASANDSSTADAADASDDAASPTDAGADVADAARSQRGCPTDAGSACFTVYANTTSDLYYLDLTSQSLVFVGSFGATPADGGTDLVTDIAVGPDDALWAVSPRALYTVDPQSGHASFVGPITACGTGTVALTADSAGTLYLGDADGQICKLDPAARPLTVVPVATMNDSLALEGDLAVVGAVAYATTRSLTNPSTNNDNSLATINLTSAATTPASNATGFPRLLGLAYGLHSAIAFTGDGTGVVVTINPSTGVGTSAGSFFDDAGTRIKFVGAGVNPRVTP